MQDNTKSTSVFKTEALGGGSVGTVPSDGFAFAPAALPGNSAYLRGGKRALDLFLASLAALLALPAALGVLLALKMKGRAPVLTRSVRLGKGERPFVFYRFPSGDSPRLRRRDRNLLVLGKLLRRSALDEIPQLWNVLRGDMTLVGPRPVLPAEAERYEPWQRRRFEVKPGLTCLWQVSGRSKLGYDEWMRLDLQYIRTQSLLLDLKILLRTLPALVARQRAR